MGKGNKKSTALKNRRKAKKNEKRAKKEMEKSQMQQEAEMQTNQSEIEENNIQDEEVYTGEVRSIDEIVEEMKTIQQKRKEFTERIQYDVEEPIDKRMQQVLERKRAEEADRKRDLAYKKVVDKILRGEEER